MEGLEEVQGMSMNIWGCTQWDALDSVNMWNKKPYCAEAAGQHCASSLPLLEIQKNGEHQSS